MNKGLPHEQQPPRRGDGNHVHRRKEKHHIPCGHHRSFREEESTSLRDMVKVLFGNDQLMWTTVSMALFMIGYCTTTSFMLSRCLWSTLSAGSWVQ